MLSDLTGEPEGGPQSQLDTVVPRMSQACPAWLPSQRPQMLTRASVFKLRTVLDDGVFE